LAITIEFVSAFGPIVLSSYAEATERRQAARRDEAPVEKHAEAAGLVVDYLAERIEPAADTETVSESALYAGYAAWCRASDLAALSLAEFVVGFDQLRAENGLGKIRKRKDGYGGIRLAALP
jgi:phage/plasmid-associated DNA primase